MKEEGKKEEKKVVETPQKVSEEAARLRREQLEKEKQAAEAARVRAAESEKQRLAALEAAKQAQAKTQAELGKVTSQEEQERLERMAGTAAKAAEARTYLVKSGDSLSKIAKREMGNANDWQKIFDANKDVIKDPNKIFPGQKIKIPL